MSNQLDATTEAISKALDAENLPPSVRDWLDPALEGRLAEAAIKALGLTQEWAVRYADDGGMREWSCGHEVIFDSRAEAEDRAKFLRCIEEFPEQSAEPVSRLVTGWVRVEQP